MSAEDELASPLAERVALVTGAASGIGRACCEMLARRGAHVMATDIDVNRLAETAAALEMIGRPFRTHVLNVADEANWKELMKSLKRELGVLRILVNNAGIAPKTPLKSLTYKRWRDVLSVNLDGVFLGSRHGIRAMRKGGSIVNIASVFGKKAKAEMSAYCASKGGACLLTRALALECAELENGVRVNAICPGGVRSDLYTRAPYWPKLLEKCGGDEEAAWAYMAKKVPLKRFAECDEVAELVCFLACDASRYVTGSEFVIDGGQLA